LWIPENHGVFESWAGHGGGVATSEPTLEPAKTLLPPSPAFECFSSFACEIRAQNQTVPTIKAATRNWKHAEDLKLIPRDAKPPTIPALPGTNFPPPHARSHHGAGC
jgi:hypothetical protein